ncbi:MAG: DUF2378 family protein [Thermoanaerobaculia bacterium]|nr:DUF2378 family protein [Thermoanaerobaculia bacterium]
MSGHAQRVTSIKGASILARLDYIRDAHGIETLDRVLESLESADRELLSGSVLPSQAYALELNGRLDVAIASIVAPDKDQALVFRELGRASAERNLTSIHSIFLTGHDPHDLLRKYPAVRRTYYSDGVATYEWIDASRGVLRVRGAVSHTQADCESTAGYYERALALVGVDDPRVDLRCRTSPSGTCEYHCSWRLTD